MLEYQDKVVQEVAACTCDRCQKRMTPDDGDLEWYERVSLSYQGGYASVFGDGSQISLDLCQQCVRETLGAWLRITPPDDGLAYQARLRAKWDGRDGDPSGARGAPQNGLDES